MADRERHTGRTVALVGGAALVAWLLLRGKGWGLGGSEGNGDGTHGPAHATPPATPCHVMIRADRIELDGTPADRATVVARCRDRGRAEVRATGDAITRSILDVLHALQQAGVGLYVAPNLERLLIAEPAL